MHRLLTTIAIASAAFLLGCTKGPTLLVEGHYLCVLDADCPADWVCVGSDAQSGLCYSDPALTQIPSPTPGDGDITDGNELPPSSDDIIHTDIPEVGPQPDAATVSPGEWGQFCSVEAYPLPEFDPTTHTLMTEDSDFHDCVFCTDHLNPDLDLVAEAEGASIDAIAGTLDDHIHLLFESGVEGPDLDTFLIRAPARTLFEFIAEPVGDSKADLAIVTMAYLGGDFNTVNNWTSINDDLSPQSTWARSMWIYPAKDSGLWAVLVTDARSLCILNDNTCDGFVGGDDYDYRLWVKTHDLEDFVRDLDVDEELQAETTLPISGALTTGGDVNIFRFQAPPPDQVSVSVKIWPSEDADAAFEPALFGMQSSVGQMQVKGQSHSFAQSVLGTSDFLPCHDLSGECDAELVDWYFFVSDWNGRGCSHFTYEGELTITPK